MKIPTEILQNLTDKDIENVFTNAEKFTLIPLLKLINHTTNINYSESFNIEPSNLENSPISEILIKPNKDDLNQNQYKIYLDLIDSDYDLDTLLIQNNLLSDGVMSLTTETNINKKDQILQIITFLIHSAKLTFENLKNKFSDLLEYNIMLDNNTTIYLDYNKPLRLGINIKQI